MKIAIVTNGFPAPSETFISNKVLAFAANGHAVTVFCTRVDKALWQKINTGNTPVNFELLTRKNIYRHLLLHPALWALAIQQNKAGRQNVGGEYLGSKINSIQPDIVHFEFSGIGLQYIDVMPKIQCKKIVSCRGTGEKVKLLTDVTRRQNMPVLFNLADAIHCVSDDMRKTILPYCSHPKKIFINYPSIDADVFKRTTAYQRNTPLHILSIGRLTFQKGYLTGLLAIKALKNTGTSFTWTIVGDGPQKEEIIFHIHQLGLQNDVTLAGVKHRAEILTLYNTCDILFLPSVYEGIANVALEAMSMELPVVSTRSGGMDEVITHGENGMLADVYDSLQLADIMATLANNSALCLTLGKNARNRILEKFILTKQVQKFEGVYKSLL